MCVRVKCPRCGGENISGSRLYDNSYLCHECHVIFYLRVDHGDQSDRSVVKEESPLEKLNDRVVLLVENRFEELIERINRLEEELKRRLL